MTVKSSPLIFRLDTGNNRKMEGAVTITYYYTNEYALLNTDTVVVMLTKRQRYNNKSTTFLCWQVDHCVTPAYFGILMKWMGL